MPFVALKLDTVGTGLYPHGLANSTDTHYTPLVAYKCSCQTIKLHYLKLYQHNQVFVHTHKRKYSTKKNGLISICPLLKKKVYDLIGILKTWGETITKMGKTTSLHWRTSFKGKQQQSSSNALMTHSKRENTSPLNNLTTDSNPCVSFFLGFFFSDLKMFFRLFQNTGKKMK